ncbi:MAG: sigma 54-interacting transcriptional regulator, partial [Planctomycetes bacterium]|nr:sigma 54-interacting transcriptional regulator [Planctomycetota bacterium]
MLRCSSSSTHRRTRSSVGTRIPTRNGAGGESVVFSDGKTAHKISPLLGESAAIEQLRDFIVGVSLLHRPVLLTGDEGTGKELAARKIHAVGRTASSPFVIVPCDRLTESEIDELLFDLAGDGESTGILRYPTGA